MNRQHKQRLLYVTIFLTGLALAAGLILYAIRQNINVFLTPHQLTSQYIASDYTIRLGGMVKKGSIVRDKEGLGVQFVVSDFKRGVTVRYEGILPDLFREGKGVIAEGKLNKNGLFIASEILAKHDENYMPDKVYRAMREEKRV